ncbi:hypothetical protein SDC9_166535 [bioreactor metagenome]|uniref:Uncharacterized protein n=1 Tax=bioreactor metagenome TaxID=1076179 RepID=A0A645FZW7_9ZZZZ
MASEGRVACDRSADGGEEVRPPVIVEHLRSVHTDAELAAFDAGQPRQTQRRSARLRVGYRSPRPASRRGRSGHWDAIKTPDGMRSWPRGALNSLHWVRGIISDEDRSGVDIALAEGRCSAAR